MADFKKFKYEDLLYLPHPVSKNHPPMDLMTRAAQFSPFSALTGYEDAVKEKQRLTQSKLELDESEKQILDEKLQEIVYFDKNQVITITYFVPDEKKEGGAYCTVTSKIRKLDSYKRLLETESGEQILLDDILNIQ